MRNEQAAVARTVDRLDMHATATALLLDLQERLGELCREALRITNNGRRPFRPSPGWEGAMGELAFAVLSLADQTGVDLEKAVQAVVLRMSRQTGGPGGGAPGGPPQGQPVGRRPPQGDEGWPLSY